MRIAVISDTHLPGMVRHLDDLGPAPAAFLREVDLILHSGDLTAPSVLDWLEQFAPVVCSIGNNDSIPDRRCEPVQMLELEGWRIGMVHSLAPEARPIEVLQRAFPGPVDIMVSGHTHLDALERRDGVVLLNSGSPTFPRHKDVRLGTVGLLELTPGRLRAEIVVLGHTPGRPNPGEATVLEIER
ncbi:MAG: metallophosphoesterase family protein [Chloroflexi bacterium]|nr:metallophosphoesterase family protein [Chloroflexota bacterium]